jgi:Rha family phage regulatory protein
MTINDMDSADTAGKPIVFQQNGRIFAGSRDVAACFDKPHKSVLRAIWHILAVKPQLGRHNFVPSEWVNEQGKAQPMYDMDRDGFVLVAMGFTGDDALEFKLRYIEAFNHMEAMSHGRPVAGDLLPASSEHRDFPDWPLDELRTKKATADLYHKVYGPLSAQWIMPQLGFPSPPRQLVELARQMGLAFEGLPPHPSNEPKRAAEVRHCVLSVIDPLYLTLSIKGHILRL